MISFQKPKNPIFYRLGFFWWCLQESNQGHKDFQSFALPTELRHQSFKTRVQIYMHFYYSQKKSKKLSIGFFAAVLRLSSSICYNLVNALAIINCGFVVLTLS